MPAQNGRFCLLTTSQQSATHRAVSRIWRDGAVKIVGWRRRLLFAVGPTR